MSKRTVSPWLSVPLILLLLSGAVVTAAYFIIYAPKAEKKRPPKMAVLVDTRPLVQSDETVIVRLTGTVIPSERVRLRARVTGEITAISPNFIEGGFLKKGEEVLCIDPVDYQLVLAKAESGFETARFNYKLEMGRQNVAKREWELLKTSDATDLEKELALRIPHLIASKASLKAAEASLEKARIDLERTHIRAPFNAVILSRNVNIGSQASLQDILAEIAGTDTCWVRLSVPVDRLEWIKIPGSRVNIFSPSGAARQGRVIKLLADLEEKGRMARLLVKVEDPFCLKPENRDSKPLLLGEYVRAEVEGRTLANVFSIPRQALHEDSFIWIATPDEKLNIRKVKVLWHDKDRVLVRDGIRTGEKLIISDITVPIDGMAINSGTGMQKKANEEGTRTEGRKPQRKD